MLQIFIDHISLQYLTAWPPKCDPTGERSQQQQFDTQSYSRGTACFQLVPFHPRNRSATQDPPLLCTFLPRHCHAAESNTARPILTHILAIHSIPWSANHLYWFDPPSSTCRFHRTPLLLCGRAADVCLWMGIRPGTMSW